MSINKANAKLVSHLFDRLNALFGTNVEITRDPLCLHHEVNRYGLRVRHAYDWEALPGVRKGLIASLKAEGWEHGWKAGPLYRHTLHRQFDGLYQGLTIDPVYGGGPWQTVFHLHPYVTECDPRLALVEDARTSHNRYCKEITFIFE